MARTTVVTRKKKATKSAPQWDELNQWCQDTTIQLNRMDKKLNAILAQGQPNQNISAELEAAIKQNSAIALHVDRQVPDKKRKK